MYYPHYKKNNKNVPILKRDEIDVIAEKYAEEFMPQIITNPQAFDIDGFAERYLNLIIDFQYLSHNGTYLGMTVFNNTNKVIIYDPYNNCANYFHADQGTVIIDNSLLRDNQEHRYRFTLGHECGHWIFHKDYFGYNPNQLSLFEADKPYQICREVNQNDSRNFIETWDEARWLEWHADKFSAGILMPKTSICNLLKNSSEMGLYDKVTLLSEVFNVSQEAAYYRLCALKYVNYSVESSEYQQLTLL
jgi:Zn-dependent peptidase ImmA (M78 family)